MVFVARPQFVPPDDHIVWEHPDAPSETHGFTWRQLLERNNGTGNPLGLLPAWKLYDPAPYRRLVETFGTDRILILSAGWGLVRADYPLPPYDIRSPACPVSPRSKMKYTPSAAIASRDARKLYLGSDRTRS